MLFTNTIIAEIANTIIAAGNGFATAIELCVRSARSMHAVNRRPQWDVVRRDKARWLRGLDGHVFRQTLPGRPDGMPGSLSPMPCRSSRLGFGSSVS